MSELSLCPICGNWAKVCHIGESASHHDNCPLHLNSLGPLLKGLHSGIKKWADEEDGVPDWLWWYYEKLREVVIGLEGG